jgi:hypothetical protein
MNRLLYILIFSTLTVACDQLTVTGPVGDATITVTELRSGETIHSGELTQDLAALEDDPLYQGEDAQLLRQIGKFDIRELPVDLNAFYLVSLYGGFDYDSNADHAVDALGSLVLGPVRGVVTGAQIQAGGHMFGALSEAAWQWVRLHVEVLSDVELRAALDEFSASVLTLVDTVDGTVDFGPPGVDYDDLLAWNPLQAEISLYTGSPAALAAMQDAMAQGAGDAERLEIAAQMTPLAVPAGAGDAWFREVVSPDVSQKRCYDGCHGVDGIAHQSEHFLVPETDPDHLEKNGDMYANLVDSYGVDGILQLAQGIGHPGGQQITPDEPEFAAFEIYLSLLAGENAGGEASLDLLADYAMASPADTLRRASLLLAGTLPSEEDLAQVADGNEETLRFMIRYLMQGEGFHQYLIEGANDRLLTDKWIENLPVTLFFAPYYPDLVNHLVQLNDSGQDGEVRDMTDGIGFGVARQPLELIAYVVDQELPYTEILTADYTMVNPPLALAYGSNVEFEDESDLDQWQVGRVETYTRVDDSTVYEPAEEFGAYVYGGLATDYPQAGVLNTPGWLARYPSTETNRNRARSRWTWYHFLGFDIEGSSPRTTDPEALADTDNPTLKNPNCTGCHEIMDPVAGAYQNYGDEGFYKDKHYGIDSLPNSYKLSRDLEEPYEEGDTWYNDMREPGFETLIFANQESTLQDLAATIVADPRFAEGAVKFWWPALMGEEIISAPTVEEDLDYEEQLSLFQAQSAAVNEFASGFMVGFNGGAPYNLKDLLVEMVLSPWFRVDSAPEPVEDEPSLRGVGTGKLLTPEQLDRKTEAVTGYRWYETEDRGIESSLLTDQYRLFYGGIDSDGVNDRATEMNSLMTTVVEAQPLQMGCILVGFEFQSPAGERQIFTEVERDQHEANAEAAIRRQLQRMHERFLGEVVAVDHPEIERALALFRETRAARIENGYPAELDGNNEESCPFFLLDVAGWDLSDPQHSLNSWVNLLAYYMTDYRYVYE